MRPRVVWFALVFSVSFLLSHDVRGEFVTDGLEVYYDTRDMTILGVERGDTVALKDRAGDDNDLVLDGSAGFSSASPSAANMYTAGGQSGAINPGTADVLVNGGGISAVGVNGPENDPNVGLTGITVEMLIRKPIANAGDILTDANFAKPGVSGTPGKRLWSLEESFSATGKLRWLVNDDFGIWHRSETPGTMPDDQWFHFLGVWGDRDGDGVQTAGYDESLVRMFINGVEIDTSPGTTGTLNTDALGRAGVFVGKVTASGQLGYFRLYNQALDTSEIAQNWADAQTFFAIPEPSTLMLSALCVCALGNVRRRR